MSEVKIIAEGDSWFAYPKTNFFWGDNSNILDWLDEIKGLKISDLSKNGDEIVTMVSGKQKLSLLRKLSNRYYDLMLISGGGNDIVGPYDFPFLLKQNQGSGNWMDSIHLDRLEMRLERIKNAYLELIELVSEYSKNQQIKIVGHTYDLASPRDVGTHLFGFEVLDPWMKPYLDKMNIKEDSDQQNIVAYILKSFAKMLKKVSGMSGGRFLVVDTQGTLNEPSDWRDEIHASSEGYRKIAEKIYTEGIMRVMEG